jgi:hypothetical protein
MQLAIVAGAGVAEGVPGTMCRAGSTSATLWVMSDIQQLVDAAYVEALLRAKKQGITPSDTPDAYTMLQRLATSMRNEFNNISPFPLAELPNELRHRGVPEDEIAIVMAANVRPARQKTAPVSAPSREWWEPSPAEQAMTALRNTHPWVEIDALVKEYRRRGLDRQAAWREYVKDTMLQPRLRTDTLDAKPFMRAFDKAR